MKIEVDGLALRSIAFEIHNTLNLVIILDDFLARHTDGTEYSSLVYIIYQQLDSINSKLESILDSEEEKNSNH